MKGAYGRRIFDVKEIFNNVVQSKKHKEQFMKVIQQLLVDMDKQRKMNMNLPIIQFFCVF